MRLVVDEAHQVFTSIEYRHQFEIVKTFAAFPVQKIFLSATIPLRLMSRFLIDTALPNSTLVIREPTPQPNIRYHVITLSPNKSTIDRFLVDLAKYLTNNFLGSKRRRGIIFCTSTSEVDKLGHSFNNCISHAKMDADIRCTNEENWFKGIQQWIVATTGLVHGIDCQVVGAVLFKNLPYGSMNLYQGFGRSGRNDEPALGFLVHEENYYQIVPQNVEDDVQAVTEGDAWMNNKIHCRRLGFSVLMDGKELRCSDLENAQQCDICDPHTDLIQAIESFILDSPQQPLAQSSATISEDFDMDQFNDDDLMAIDMDQYNQPKTLLPMVRSKSDVSSPISHIAASSPFSFTSPETSFTSANQRSYPKAKSTSLSMSYHQPASAAPSMSVQLDAAIYAQTMATKEKKGVIINHMTGYLHDSCVVCWAWKHRRVSKIPPHKLFLGCKDITDHTLPYYTNWGAFKSSLKLPGPYKYCFKCGLPQGDYQPSCHPVFQQHQRMICPLEHFVVGVLWFIRHDHPTWTAACQVFKDLSHQMTDRDFKIWVEREKSVGHFYNGLELVIWFWLKRQENS